MAKIKTTNEAGEEVEIEVHTDDEMKAKLDAQEAEFNNKLAEKDSVVTALATEKADLENKLNGIKPDHPNFAALKEALDKKSEEIKTLRTEIDTDKKTRAEEAMDSKIKLASKGNTDFEKKIKLNLETSLKGMPETNDAERAAKVAAAVKLSSDADFSGGPGIFDSGISGGGYSGDRGGDTGNHVEFTKNEKLLGKRFGITDEDYKKYGGRLTNKRK
jgi:hypothetical protein